MRSWHGTMRCYNIMLKHAWVWGSFQSAKIQMLRDIPWQDIPAVSICRFGDVPLSLSANLSGLGLKWFIIWKWPKGRTQKFNSQLIFFFIFCTMHIDIRIQLSLIVGLFSFIKSMPLSLVSPMPWIELWSWVEELPVAGIIWGLLDTYRWPPSSRHQERQV